MIRFADYTGDSFKLSREVAKHPHAEFIVFCGVHFMAESADVLALPHQKVILPDLAAGCSMADMAPADELEICWSELEQMGVASRTVPVTYINSAAAMKSFVGEHGGTVCTSSNAARRARVGLGAEGEDPVPARPAPGPQHRVLPHGRAARPDGGVGSASCRSAG